MAACLNNGEQNLKPGIYPELSNAEYHGGPGVSKSILDLMSRSPMHAKHKLDAANDNEPKESTPAQQFGTAFHTLILEPHLFVQQYTLGLRKSDAPDAIDSRDDLVAKIEELNKHRLPKLSSSGTKGELIERIMFSTDAPNEHRDVLASRTATELKQEITAINVDRTGLLSSSGSMHELAQALRDAGLLITLWSDVKAEWERNNGHRTILSPEDFDALHGMREATHAHPAAEALFYTRSGRAEQSVYWIDELTGELCRCRPDFWRDDNVIVDLKTTEDASPEGFAKSIANWSYHKQDAFYRDGVEAATGKPVKAFVFVAVEKKAPYAVGVYMLDDLGRDIGRAEYRADLSTWAQCKKTNLWPGYSSRIESIALPAWEINKKQHLINAA